MTLTQGLIFVVTMFILFGGLFYTIWVFRQESSQPAPLRVRGRDARRGVGRGGRA